MEFKSISPTILETRERILWKAHKNGSEAISPKRFGVLRPNLCCVPIRLLILCPKSMYSFCEEEVHTFEYVAE